MTPQEIEKEANELIPAYIPGTHPKFYNREEAVTIFISGANLVMERVRVLEEALKHYAIYRYGNKQAMGERDSRDVALEAFAALEGK